MNFLIDTNILIPIEPTSFVDLELNTELGIDFFRLVQKSQNKIFIHPAIKYDLARDKNVERANLRKKLINKYSFLSEPPTSDILESKVQKAVIESNDWVDNQLLAAIYADAADYLVTEDIGIHKKARKLEINSRVILLSNAVTLLHNLFDKIPEPPPAIEDVHLYEIDNKDPIFDSLRADYLGFDEWLNKCKKKHRKAYIIKKSMDSNLAAICIKKTESELPDGRKGKTLKLCTIKVAPEHEGNRYGELLLKTIFEYVRLNGYMYVYFTAFPKQEKLIMFAKDFGFYEMQNNGEELILAKDFIFSEDEKMNLSAIDFNIKYGPLVTSFFDNNTFIIPIQPKYHSILFPECENQTEFWPGRVPCGNSIKKAYLSHSQTSLVKRGDNIFFYRSEDYKSLTVLGIIEGTLRSNNPNEIAKYVGKRTVYTFNTIKEMCNKELLAIKFRLVDFLDEPISIDNLIKNSVIKAAPQSITKGKNIKWLQKQIKM